MAEGVDHPKAFLDPGGWQTRGRQQRAVFRIDVAPGDAKRAGAPGQVDSIGCVAAVTRGDRYGGALPVKVRVFSGRWANANLVDQGVDDGIGDFRVTRMNPAKAVIGHAGRGEVGRAMRHADQVGRVQRAAQLGEARARDSDAVDLRRGNVAVARGIRRRLGEGVVGDGRRAPA